MPDTVDVISLGNAASREFTDVRLQLLSQLPHGFRGCWLTIPAYLNANISGVPDVVVVWQTTSDEFPPDQIAALLASIPLARMLCVFGPWCEADGRTRMHWPPALRVPIWQATARFETELRTLHDPQVAALPWTASREEVWLRDVTAAEVVQLAGIRVVLDCPDPAYRATLSTLITGAGGMIVADESPPDVVVIDIEPWTPQQSERLEACRQRYPQATRIAVSGWTTHDLQKRGIEHGCSVVPKLAPDALLQKIAGCHTHVAKQGGHAMAPPTSVSGSPVRLWR